MDTNEQLLQTNTFIGGMDTDTSSVNIDKNSYRYAENIRINQSDEHGIGDIHVINGVNKIPVTFDYDSEEVMDCQVIACQVAQNYIVLVLYERKKDTRFEDSGIPLHKNRMNKEECELYKNIAQNKTQLYYNTTSGLIILDVYLTTYVYLEELVMHHDDYLHFSSVYDAYCYMWEYFLDNSNVIVNFTITTLNENTQQYNLWQALYEKKYYPGDAQWRILVNDNNGIGNYKTVFGPCKDAIYTIQDGFVKDINTAINYVDSKHVYLYIADSNNIHPLTCLNVASNEYLGNSISALTGTSSSRITTKIVNGSGLIPYKKVQYLYRFKNPGTGSTSVIMPPSKLLSIYYGDNSGGFDSNTNSSKSVKITISYPPGNNFNHVEVYRIGYYGYNTYRLRKIYDDVYTINNHQFTITDTGSDTSTVNYALDELINFETTQIGKIIAKKDNRLFKSAIFDDLDNADILFRDIDTISYTSGQSKANPYVHSQFNTSYLEYFEKWWRKPGSDYEHGGIGKYINWEYVVAKHYVWAFSLQGPTTIAHPCLRSGEVYRFAIVFYLNDGTHTSPKWIADIMIPEDLNHSSERQNDGNVKFTTRSYNIKFTVDTARIKEEVPAFSGYAIVTAKRNLDDKIVLSQGITASGQACTRGLQNDARYRYFASPETAYRKDDFFNLLNSYGENAVRISFLTAYDVFRDEMSLTYSQIDNPYNPPYTYSEATYVFTTTPSYVWKHISGTPYPDYLGLYYGLSSSTRINRHMNIMIPNTNTAVSLYNTDNKHTIPYFFNPPVIGLTGITENGSGSTLLLDSYFITTRDGDNIYATSETSLRDDFKLDCLKADKIGYGGWKFVEIYPGTSMYAYGNRIGYKLYKHFIPITQFDHDIIIANLKRINVIPYGGHNEVSINDTEYRVDYNINYNINNQSEYIVSSDGVSSIGVFWFLGSHNMIDNTYKAINATTAELTIVPMEADFDLNAIYGCDITQINGDFNVLHLTENEHDRTYNFPVHGDLQLKQDKKLYMYDSTYSSTPQIVLTSTNNDDLNSETYYNRIYASDPFAAKSEYNAWLKYTDNILLDYEYGRITGLKFFKDRLYFWQERAFGVLYINENTIIQDKDNEHDILLSTSGMFSDYKYISIYYGLKADSSCIACSENFLYWWDEYKKEILVFDGKLVSPLSTIKNIKRYIDSGTVNVVPHVIYDYKNKDVLFCVVNNECVVYNERFECFTSIYKIEPRNFFYTSVGQLMLVKNNSIYKYDESVNGMSYGFDNKPLYLSLKYIINKDVKYTKVFDTILFYGSIDTLRDLTDLSFNFKTPLNLQSTLSGDTITKYENQFRKITDREGDFRFSIPRDYVNGLESHYGGRLKGKFLECELKYNNNNTDFSVQYINTKFRISWI